jgi:sterol desaturase/sphingolipid hydroxylase (fatty acid hydroxylase superfamily)
MRGLDPRISSLNRHILAAYNLRMKESMFNAKDAGTFHRRFFMSPEIIGYFGMTVVAGIVTALIAPGAGAALWPMAVMVVLYPVAEYLLHRYLLHAKFLAKSQLTSPLWYRIHYRHHSKPSDQSVILAAPYTIVGAVAIIAGLLALLIGSLTAFTAGLTVGGLLIIAYEYAHSVCHSAFPTENRYLKSIRTNHVLHHFHSESGNYGITNSFSDVLFGTRYDEKSLPQRSATVRNLGYDEEMRRAFPWIAQIEANANARTSRLEPVQQPEAQ